MLANDDKVTDAFGLGVDEMPACLDELAERTDANEDFTMIELLVLAADRAVAWTARLDRLELAELLDAMDEDLTTGGGFGSGGAEDLPWLLELETRILLGCLNGLARLEDTGEVARGIEEIVLLDGDKDNEFCCPDKL